MKKIALAAAALLAVSAIEPGWAASKTSSKAAGNCYSQQAIEAEEAIRYVTDLMVYSSACQNTMYGEFRARNQTEIISYQKAMIAHFHGAPAFDRWNTALANMAAQKQSSIVPATYCQQSETQFKQTAALDAKGFHAFAAAQAAAAAARYTKCGK